MRQKLKEQWLLHLKKNNPNWPSAAGRPSGGGRIRLKASKFLAVAKLKDWYLPALFFVFCQAVFCVFEKMCIFVLAQKHKI